jgi:hypothetical protein
MQLFVFKPTAEWRVDDNQACKEVRASLVSDSSGMTEHASHVAETNVNRSATIHRAAAVLIPRLVKRGHFVVPDLYSNNIGANLCRNVD